VRPSVRGDAAHNSALAGAIWSVAAPAPLHELSFDVGVRDQRRGRRVGRDGGTHVRLEQRARGGDAMSALVSRPGCRGVDKPERVARQ